MGYKMQIKVDFLCRDSILAAPIVLDLAIFLDLAKRAGMSGIQEWLSFYLKSPQTAPGLYPEHDIFIQLMKLKNTLRHLKGEELITHLGLEYYDYARRNAGILPACRLQISRIDSEFQKKFSIFQFSVASAVFCVLMID